MFQDGNLISLNYNSIKNLTIFYSPSTRYHRNLKKNILVYVGTIPLANYQPPVAAPPRADEYPTKPADPSYGGYPSGYPAFEPKAGYPDAPSAPVGPGFVNPVQPSGPTPNGPPPLPPTMDMYPNLRKHVFEIVDSIFR